MERGCQWVASRIHAHQANVAVSKGAFTAELDFGEAAFPTGEARWLQIAVRCPAGSGSYTPLTPRQTLTAAPDALYSRGVWDFGASRRLQAGTPGGRPDAGWTFYSTSGHRRDNVGDNAGLYLGASSTSSAATYDQFVISENGNVGIGLVTPNNGKLQVYTASGDAIEVTKAGDDGIHIGDGTNFPGWGIWMIEPGVVYTGVTARTAQPSGEWGMYTPDKIHATNVTLQTVTLVAVVDGAAELNSGDLVAAVGYIISEMDDSVPLARVALADEEAIAAADRLGLAMVFTGERHFRH